jgi:hypothetical protein
MEIVADHHSRNLQFPGQKIDELGRRQGGEILVEAAHESSCQAQAGEDRQLNGLRRQAEQRSVGLEIRARMRLEGDRRAGSARSESHVQEMTVPPVNPVEIADGHHGPFEPRGHELAVAAHGEGGIRLRRRIGGHGIRGE